MKTVELENAKRLVAEGAALPAAERLALQQERLHELVGYVKTHSPYFAALYAGIKNDFRLTDLPVTEKKTLLEHYDEWVTDRRIHLQDVLDYVARDASKDQSLFLGEYTALRTSGSTGNPLPMVRDDYHNKIHSQLIAQRLFGNVDMDVLDISKHKRASVIHLSNGASSYGAFLRMKAAHPESAHNLLGVSVLDSVDHIVDQLNDFQPETMAGYPSMLVQLALQQQAGKLHLNLKHLATSGEMLSESNYYLLKDAFKCPVANNYCMTEGGEIAMTHNCPHLHVNEDWVIIEPVDRNMQPVKDSNDWSEGVLVTDLSNFVQPIIRYYVSDVIRLHRDSSDCCPLPRMEIRGRTLDMYTICGKTFGVVGLVTETEVWPDVSRYQFVQTSDDTLELRALCNTGADKAKVMNSLCTHLKAFFSSQGCPDANLVWSDKPFIPNRRGGKIPVYIKL